MTEFVVVPVLLAVGAEDMEPDGLIDSSGEDESENDSEGEPEAVIDLL